MASIIASNIFLDNIQTDGRRTVIERFTCDDGIIIQQSYMATPDMDINARLGEHADQINNDLQIQAG